jgi:acetylornithine deacetylase/succinyl-diaminopimelate desuccinylase-like protein
MIYNY